MHGKVILKVLYIIKNSSEESSQPTVLTLLLTDCLTLFEGEDPVKLSADWRIVKVFMIFKSWKFVLDCKAPVLL